MALSWPVDRYKPLWLSAITIMSVSFLSAVALGIAVTVEGTRVVFPVLALIPAILVVAVVLLDQGSLLKKVGGGSDSAKDTSNSWKGFADACGPELMWILKSSSCLLLLLLIRLLFVGHFRGNIADLDFGKGINPESNEAFTPQFNSFGHCIQGALVVFYFPTKCFLPIWNLRELFGFGMVVYPLYNVIKRTSKSASSFASSSYSNNNTEWAFGLIYGVALGLTLTHLAPAASATLHQYAKYCRLICAAALGFAWFFAMIMMAQSWNHPGDDHAGQVLTVVCPSLMYIFFGWSSYKQSQKPDTATGTAYV